MPQNKITIPSHDNSEFQAYIAMPDVTPAPVIIMIQEIFGINQEMIDKCNHMADLGYIAVAPDLFWRIEPGINLVDSNEEELKRAFHLFAEFDQDLGLKDLQSTLDFIRTLDDSNSKVGTIGYCLGGKMAYRMACETSIDSSVSYYGVGIEAILDKADHVQKPLLLHIAANDEYVPPEAQEKIIETMLDNEFAETYKYPGMDHAFARGNGMHFNAEAAKLANDRTEKFLLESLKA